MRKYPLRRYFLVLGTDPRKMMFFLRLYLHSSALPRVAVLWQCFWNSDHVVWKSSICTSALPWRQRSDRGLRVTQHANFSIMTHTKQLLLLTFCQPTAGIGSSFVTDARRTADGGGRTDRHGSRNSYSDKKIVWSCLNICLLNCYVHCAVLSFGLVAQTFLWHYSPADGDQSFYHISSFVECRW